MAELLNERILRNGGELRLHGVAEGPDELIARAEAAELGYRELLDRKTLDKFDASFQPELDPKRITELRSLRFLERKSVVLDPRVARRRQESSLVGIGDGGAWPAAIWSATRHSTISSAARAKPMR